MADDVEKRKKALESTLVNSGITSIQVTAVMNAVEKYAAALVEYALDQKAQDDLYNEKYR